MKNTKEVHAILTAIYCINFTSAHPDDDINKIIDYAFRRLFGANTNFISLCCVGKNRQEMMPFIKELLESETEYYQYLRGE